MPTLKGWGVMLPLLESSVSTESIWNSSAWKTCLSPLFIQPFIQIKVTHGYLFCTLDHNPVLLYFIAEIVPALTIGSNFSWRLHPFDIFFHQHKFFGSFVLSSSLLSGTTTGSRLILYSSCPRLESATSPRILGSCFQRIVLEIKIQVLSVPSWCYYFKAITAYRARRYRVYTHIYKYFCTNILCLY